MDVRASSMSSTDELEPVELLDDYWFFHNLFQKKNRMFRSSSDPYPSSNSMDEVFALIKGKESSQSTTNHKLQKTPSLPVSVGRVKGLEEDPNKESAETKSTNHLPKENGLQRAPSLPLKTGKDKGIGETRRSSKLTRQTSLSSSNVLPPLHASKGAAPSSAIPPKRLMRRDTMVERTSKDGKPRLYIPTDMHLMHRSLSQNKMSKSPTELETEEVQGFKDLGFDFDKIDLNPSVADIIPGLQSKKPDYWKEDKVRRPYLSEAWVVQKSTPLTVMPDLIVPGSAGDMKKHLKYWARAVASNMRQEC